MVCQCRGAIVLAYAPITPRFLKGPTHKKTTRAPGLNHTSIPKPKPSSHNPKSKTLTPPQTPPLLAIAKTNPRSFCVLIFDAVLQMAPNPLAVWLTLGDFLQFLTISKACLGVAPFGPPVPGSPVPWSSGLLVLWSSGPLVGGSLASQDLSNFISRMPT